jgi:hypothetical protein
LATPAKEAAHTCKDTNLTPTHIVVVR